MSKLVENQYDAYCKKVLRFKMIMAKILHDTVSEFKSMTLEEIIEILNQDDLDERMSVLNTEDIIKPNAKIFYDLLMHIQSEEGMFVDVEPQGRISDLHSFMNRCIHTGARMIVWQRNETKRSHEDDFSDLKSCISIWIVLNPPKKHRGKIAEIYQDQRSIEGNAPVMEKSLAKQRIIIMYLHDEIDVEDKSALMMLSILFSAKLSREDRVLYLKKHYGIVLNEAEKEVIGQMCNAHEGIYEYGKEEVVKIGLIEGEGIGLAKGKKLGLEEGKEIEKLTIAKKMMKLGVALEIITMTTGLTYPEVMDLKH